jgi:hypothetical protein
MEGSGCSLIYGTIPAFAWKENNNNLIRTGGVPVEF